jgi:hypothetical protein
MIQAFPALPGYRLLLLSAAERVPAPAAGGTDCPLHEFNPVERAMDILTTGWVLAVLVLLLLVEMAVDKIPGIDTLDDGIQTAGRPFAGSVLFAAGSGIAGELHPVPAIVAGLLIAGGVHAEQDPCPARSYRYDRRDGKLAGQSAGRSCGASHRGSRDQCTSRGAADDCRGNSFPGLEYTECKNRMTCRITGEIRWFRLSSPLCSPGFFVHRSNPLNRS